MTHQLTFAELRRARAGDPQTSRAAARQASGLASEHCRRILAVLRHDEALTAHDIAKRCDLDPIQVSRRLGQLRDDGHIVVDPDAVGVTPTGRTAQCWRLP